jgi:hypothetical protein
VHSMHHSSAVRHTRTIFSTFSSRISSRRVHSMHHFSRAFYAPFFCRTPYPDYFSTFSSRIWPCPGLRWHLHLDGMRTRFCASLPTHASSEQMAPPSGWNADTQQRVPTEICFI